MKKLVLVVIVMTMLISLFGIEYDKVVCDIDSFTGEIRYNYTTNDIDVFKASYVFINPDGSIYLTFMYQSENWKLLGESKKVLFLIDGELYEKKFILDTSVNTGYVLEFATIITNKKFILLIVNSKECKVRVGHSLETVINQKYKNGMKELLTK